MIQLFTDNQTVDACHELARQIAQKTYGLIESYTTKGVERAVLRLMGLQGTTTDELQIPLANVLTDMLNEAGVLQNGAGLYFAFLNEHYGESATDWLPKLYRHELTLPDLKRIDVAAWRTIAYQLVEKGLTAIKYQRQKREGFIQKYGERPTPWLYVIVATGNIYEDVEQAEIAVRQGADVIAVIRSTAQSLLDYVPENAVSDGVAGTYATQQNFKLMRTRLDTLGEELGRYIRLTNYASGLCMAEMAVLGAQERLDMMLSDSLYGILFRDINMIRTFTDQHFARMIQAYGGIIINTGEDNYLTTTEQYEAMHTVLASQFINRQFAHLSGLPDSQIGLGHAFEMNPDIENGLLLSMADALLCRACFPDCPLKYMPPTKHIDGNIFFAHIANALFNLTSVATNQHIHLVGILSEAIHTPFLHERFLAIQNSQYLFHFAKNFMEEFSLNQNGLMQQRAKMVLADTLKVLQQIDKESLPTYIEQGLLAGMSRTRMGGKGYDGVITKSAVYVNPVIDLIK